MPSCGAAAMTPFKDDACQADGFPHLYHGGDIRPLRAEYSEPSKGRGEEVASH